jgi:hypothetical protein
MFRIWNQTAQKRQITDDFFLTPPGLRLDDRILTKQISQSVRETVMRRVKTIGKRRRLPVRCTGAHTA